MSYRLWFRLDHILPIAEHAMAYTTHRLPGAQALALDYTRPTLYWEGKSTMDVLVSGGMPARYGDTGTDHIAKAHTWLHTATDRYGTASADGYDTTHLPLDVASNKPTAIDLLRDARYTGRHWIAIDIDPADQQRIPPSRIRALDHRDQLVPADST